MKLSWSALIIAALPGVLVRACDGHNHARRADHNNNEDHGTGRGNPPSKPITPPSQPLKWGDINFIHTTDSHGWLLGHQKGPFPEPNYSGDLGDFASFVAHMNDTAKGKQGADLLLIDGGDLHDGTGLTDGFLPGGVDGHEANEFIKMLPYDVMTIGNHDLTNYNYALDMYKNFAPALKGRYLTSNVNITADGSDPGVPIGARFRQFKTQHDRKITALGILFEFNTKGKGTIVQKVADMVKEDWFKKAIQEKPDLFLLVGHMSLGDKNWSVVFDAVRAVHETTPIVILGGHTHHRACKQFDKRSMSLESGRYMETVGWMSVKLGEGGGNGDVEFSRRYLDANRATYEFHTGKVGKNFDTALGQRIKSGLRGLSDKFRLSEKFGTAPQDYFVFSVPYSSPKSLLSLFIRKAVPTALTLNNPLATKPALFLSNGELLRYDLFAGPFTRDDQFKASPLIDTFLYLPSIKLSVVVNTVKALKDAAAHKRRSAIASYGNSTEQEQHYNTWDGYNNGDVEEIFKDWLKNMYLKSGFEKRTTTDLTPGYVTKDSCPGGPGDDTLHTLVRPYPAPDFISSDPPTGAGITPDTRIDFVFLDHIRDKVLPVINSLQTEKVYVAKDAQPYSGVLSDAVLGVFAKKEWQK